MRRLLFRFVVQAVRLFVLGVVLTSPILAQPGSHAEQIDLMGIVQHPRSFGLADLQTFPPLTVTTAFETGRGFEVATFPVVSLWTLLREAEVQQDPDRHNDLHRKYVVVTGRDDYEAIFSLGELNPELSGDIVIEAYRRNGELLGPSEGMARLVTTGTAEEAVWSATSCALRCGT